MQIEGEFSDGRSAHLRSAHLRASDGSLRVVGADGTALTPDMPLADVEVSSRLGSTPRHIRFASGASFSTDDNDAVDQLLSGSRPASSFVHRLESHWRFIVVAVAVTVSVVAASIVWGVPAAARHVAFALPASFAKQSEKAALDLVDGRLFKPSTLQPAEQARLLEAFRPILDAHEPALGLNVRFRDAQHSVGANAFALPAGTIVFTDQLVHLARNDEELIAILAHEAGHVAHRHALRSTVQASTLSLMAALVLGDVSSVASAAASVPILLTELGYSREFEREADRHAIDTLHAAGIPPHRLADILGRLAPEDSGGYWSTHPPTPDRLQAIHDAAAQLR